MKAVKGKLLCINNGRGLLYKHLVFYWYDFENGEMDLIGRIPSGITIKILCRLRLFNRLMRMEPRCVGRLDGFRYVTSFMGKIWLVDILKKRVTAFACLRPGYSILNFCEKDGFLYWGDYGANIKHEDIKIYRLDKDLNLTIVYSFPHNSIRHVHNIIKNGDGFIVMCGDNEPQAGLYIANSDWTEVYPWKIGQQKYRAVVGYSHNGGLLYATDSVETENHLRQVKADGRENVLTSINGSCIYGGETKDYYLLSTTVEPHEGGGVWNMLSNKLGDGIKSREVHLLAVNKQDLSIRVIKRYRKDIWPMKLFQYGQATFPIGMDFSNKLYFNPIACKGADGVVEEVMIDE